MYQQSTRAVKDVLDSSFGYAVGLRHARLWEFMPPAESHIPYRPYELVGVVGIYDFWANSTNEVLQGFLDFDGTLG